MRIIKFQLFESLDETIYKEIQNMIDNNQFLKGTIKADNTTVFEAGDFILLLGDLSHIVNAHVKDDVIPGSKFKQGLDLKKAIISLVRNNKPTEMTKGFGSSETKVSDAEQAEKFKWLGLDSKTDVGFENVHKLDTNSEEFKSLNAYTYKDSRGNEFKVKVKQEDGKATSFLSFIGAKLGKIGDKPILSIVTAFPGQNAVNISDRNKFTEQGYYFSTQNKEIIEKSSGQMSESVINFNRFFGNLNGPSEKLNFHLEKKISIFDNVFRPGSQSFYDLIREARRFIELLNEHDRELYETTDLGIFDYFEGELVPLDLPMLEDEGVNEAEYQGKNVKLNSPMRSSGPKKYKVYVRNPKTGKVMKVNFGDLKGGLTSKVNDPKARKKFASRHNCAEKKDKTKAGYWSCRLPRFKNLVKSSHSGWW